MEPVDAAQRVAAEHFPEAIAVLLGASVLGAARTATSDLDLVVVLDGPPAPFRQTLRAHGWVVETFVHTRSSLEHYWGLDVQQRRPALLRMCAQSRVVASPAGEAERIRTEAQERLAAGPPQLTADERDRHRYVLTDLLDDLEGCQDPGELAHIAAGVLVRASEVALVVSGRWRGTGKWLHRELVALDAGLAAELVTAHRAALADGDTAPLSGVAHRVLEQAGGRLLEGFVAPGEDPSRASGT
jgi:hypothetical protein